MTINATLAAESRSTYVVGVTFYDEDGDLVVPTQIRWSLRDNQNSVVNHRSNEPVAPASQVNIVLSGDDLALQNMASVSEVRRLIVSCKYDSELGSDLPLVGSYEFRVLNTFADTGLLSSVSASASASPSI